MSEHIGDDAALYALGTLDETERAKVESHVDACDACSRLLAQALDDVTAVVEAGVQSRMPLPASRSNWRRWFAPVAAAIVLAILPTAYLLQQNLAMHRAMVAESQAMERVATSPHRMVAFTGMDAKVMYGMHGSWYVVIVRNAKAPVDVAWMHDGTKTMLGKAEPHGDVALLYLPKSHRMDQLALVSNDHTMAQATLVY